MQDKISIGLIGYGRAAQILHLPALRRIDDARILMVSDLQAENIRQAKRDLPETTTSVNYLDVLNNPDIDVVAIFTPALLHAEIGQQAFEQGKHLLIEKPLALTVEDCDQLLAAEKASHSIATVGFNLRFHRQVTKMKSIVRSGQIGSIEAVRSVWTGNMRRSESLPNWRKEGKTGGSVVFEVASHHFDLWKYILGENLLEIKASSIKQGDVDRSASISAVTKSGIPITGLFSDWTADNNELEIYGDKGAIKLSLHRIDGLKQYDLTDYAGGLSTRMKEAKDVLSDIINYPKSLRLGGDFRATYFYEWKALISKIRGLESNSPALADGKDAVKTALATLESIKTSRTVTLN
jgi:predicted dehydrogenase